MGKENSFSFEITVQRYNLIIVERKYQRWKNSAFTYSNKFFKMSNILLTIRIGWLKLEKTDFREHNECCSLEETPFNLTRSNSNVSTRYKTLESVSDTNTRRGILTDAGSACIDRRWPADCKLHSFTSLNIDEYSQDYVYVVGRRQVCKGLVNSGKSCFSWIAAIINTRRSHRNDADRPSISSRCVCLA